MDSNRLPEFAEAASRLSPAQFLMFSLVGATGTAVHYAILLGIVELLGFNVMLGTICGSIGGAIVNYLLNSRFTFDHDKGFVEAASRFAVVAICGLFLNAGLVFVLVRSFSVGYFWIQIFVTLMVLFFNYVLNALWTFGRT